MRHLKLSIAKSIADLRAVQRTRYVSYQEQSGARVLYDPRVRRDISSGDTSETSQHIMVCDEGRCVATARLSLPDPDLLRAPGHRLGFEIEAHWDLRDLDPLRGSLVEVSRLAVLREYWASSAALRLYEGITRLSRDLGASYLIGAVDSGTDHPDDARIMRRVLAVRGGEGWEFHVRPAASCPADGVDRKPQTDFYTAEQRKRARDGDLTELPISRALAALTDHLGARCIGGPAWHPSFGRMVLPLLLDLRALPARTLAMFRRVSPRPSCAPCEQSRENATAASTRRAAS